MEEDRKKKKNKKKKNKQAKALEDVKVTNGETAVPQQNHTSASEQNNCTQISEVADVGSTGVIEPDVNPSSGHSNGTVGANLDEEEKRLWLQKEAMLEEKVKRLVIDKDSCIEREVVLEKKIIDLQKEKDSWLQKEASMDQTLKELLNERALWTLKRAGLEDIVQQLENDKESWFIKEKATKETIDRLTNDFTEVQAQVKVLQESRDGLLQENQLLMERISVLQSLVQHLEEECSLSASSTTKTVQHASTDEDENAQMAAEEPITENTEVIGKGMDPVVHKAERTTDIDLYELREKLSNLLEEERVESPAIVHSYPDTTSVKLEEINAEDSPRSSETGETEEIVQIPLDENEIREVEVQDMNAEDKDDVALTDAPLTGAPFRFISFVARYVSGADLVNKSNSNSGR